MLELESVSFRNILSYGDYTTKIKLDSLQQCLVTGEVVTDGLDEKDRSNGSGKSSLANVILWVLFGRTMHEPNPGDAILNWFTGGDGWAEVRFKNGDTVSRTRTRRGTTELIFVTAGDATTLTSDTLATTKHQQARFNREFGLDWEVFCGSVFFTQYNKPWMDMGEQSRKQAIERMIHVDRFTTYGQIANEKAQKLDQERLKRKSRLEGLETDVTRTLTEIEQTKLASEGFSDNQKSRSEEEITRAVDAEAVRDALELPDLQELERMWTVVTKIKDKIAALRTDSNKTCKKANIVLNERDGCNIRITDCQTRIKRWREKDGRECPQCEQKVPHNHVSTRIEPIEDELNEHINNRDKHVLSYKNLMESASLLDQEADTIEQKLIQRTPKITTTRVSAIHQEWKQYDNDVRRYKKSAADILLETNPHNAHLLRLQERLDKLNAEAAKLRKEIETIGLHGRHYLYVVKAYSDRKKVKSFAIADHLPYVNDRLSYYLDVFELDLKMQFNSSLGIDHSMWSYNFYCGGERKRTDLAIMFSMFDMHEKMYGRQSNVMVLDEVDSRLDGVGMEALIQIIKNDLSSKVETILIISHRRDMFDVFPHHIHVSRTGRLSQLVEVR